MNSAQAAEVATSKINIVCHQLTSWSIEAEEGKNDNDGYISLSADILSDLAVLLGEAQTVLKSAVV